MIRAPGDKKICMRKEIGGILSASKRARSVGSADGCMQKRERLHVQATAACSIHCGSARIWRCNYVSCGCTALQGRNSIVLKGTFSSYDWVQYVVGMDNDMCMRKRSLSDDTGKGPGSQFQ